MKLKFPSTILIGVIISYSFLFNPLNVKANDSKEKSEVIIKYSNSTKDINKTHMKNSYKLKKVKSLNTHTEVLEIDKNDNIEKVINSLSQNPDIEYVQPNYQVELDSKKIKDEYFNFQWNLLNYGQEIATVKGVPNIDINLMDSLNLTNNSKNILVGILDTGIDINHDDLKKGIYINHKEKANNGLDDDQNGYIDDVNGWDFLNNNSSVYKSPYLDIHGTHVAGILAAQDNKIGIRGISPNAKIVPLRFIEGTKGYTSDAIEAIEYAKKLGVSIINCSWGGKQFNQALYDTMKNSDIFFVSSSGNQGYDTMLNPIYPAAFDLPNVISVSAIDNTGSIAPFSNYGENVEIAAPGVNIVSTIPQNGYYMLSGTSMAAPHVTAAAALILSNKPNFPINSIKSHIINNVTTLNSLNSKVSSSGILNINKTLTNLSKNNY